MVGSPDRTPDSIRFVTQIFQISSFCYEVWERSASRGALMCPGWVPPHLGNLRAVEVLCPLAAEAFELR